MYFTDEGKHASVMFFLNQECVFKVIGEKLSLKFLNLQNMFYYSNTCTCIHQFLYRFILFVRSQILAYILDVENMVHL